MSLPPTRRERLRQQALDEIKQHAVEQVGGGGSAALSLNAIGKAMGMSGPAIYRYYASREELLDALVIDGYGELARVVQAAAADGSRRTPARRLAQVVDAYRAWALENPHRYGLLFSVRPEGYADPGEAITAIEPGMQVLLELIGAIAGGAGGSDAGAGAENEADVERRTTAGARLDADLVRWAATRGDDRRNGAAEPEDASDDDARPATEDESALPPVQVLRLGVLIWTRMHGVIMLELAGIVGDMGLDGGLLVQAELETIVAEASAG